jgi:hypothetical protein
MADLPVSPLTDFSIVKATRSGSLPENQSLRSMAAMRARVGNPK